MKMKCKGSPLQGISEVTKNYRYCFQCHCHKINFTKTSLFLKKSFQWFSTTYRTKLRLIIHMSPILPQTIFATTFQYIFLFQVNWPIYLFIYCLPSKLALFGLPLCMPVPLCLSPTLCLNPYFPYSYNLNHNIVKPSLTILSHFYFFSFKPLQHHYYMEACIVLYFPCMHFISPIRTQDPEGRDAISHTEFLAPQYPGHSDQQCDVGKQHHWGQLITFGVF